MVKKKKTAKKKKDLKQIIFKNALHLFLATLFCLAFAIGGYHTASTGALHKTYTSFREHLSSDYNNYHFFLHTPKTGTSGLRADYSKYYTKKAYTPVMLFITHINEKTDDKYVRCYDNELYQEINFVAGHINFGFHCDLNNYTYSTILREPVARMWSYYKYFVLGPRIKKSKTKDINEHHKVAFPLFMETGYFALDNGQVRRISGIGTEVPFGEVNRGHLELAKKNLKKHFIVVGVLEDYRKYQIMVETIIGAEMNYESYKNKSKMDFPKSNITQEQIDEIKELNKYDYELYDFVVEMSEEIFSKLPEEAKQKYESVKDL